MLSASLMPLFGGEVWTFLFMEYWNSHSQAWKRACTERSRWCCCGKRERGKILIIWFNSYVDWKTSIQMFIKIFLFRQEIERSRKGRVAAEALALAGCERGLNWTNISTTFLSNKYLFKYLSQPIRIITMILCCNNISLIFLQRIYVVHNISPTNTCCTCNSAIYIVTITTPSFSYTRTTLVE